MLSRRQLLASIGVAFIGATSLGAWRFVRSTDSDAIIAVVRKRLSYLRLDEQGLSDYARDLAATGSVSSRKLRLIDAAGPLYTHLLPNRMSVLTREIRHGEERIVSQYLLSSDFFQNGADESRLVCYREYYDPAQRLSLCSNPFSRPNE